MVEGCVQASAITPQAREQAEQEQADTMEWYSLLPPEFRSATLKTISRAHASVGGARQLVGTVHAGKRDALSATSSSHKARVGVGAAELTKQRDDALAELELKHPSMTTEQVQRHSALEYLRFRIRTACAALETSIAARTLALEQRKAARDSGTRYDTHLNMLVGTHTGTSRGATRYSGTKRRHNRTVQKRGADIAKDSKLYNTLVATYNATCHAGDATGDGVDEFARCATA